MPAPRAALRLCLLFGALAGCDDASTDVDAPVGDAATVDMSAADMRARDMSDALDGSRPDLAAADMTAADMAAVDMRADDMHLADAELPDMAAPDVGLMCPADQLTCGDRCQRARVAENCGDACCPRVDFEQAVRVDVPEGTVARLAIPTLAEQRWITVRLDAADAARCPAANFSVRLVHVGPQDTLVGDATAQTGQGRVTGCRTLQALVEADEPYALRVESLGPALALTARITHAAPPPMIAGPQLAGDGRLPRAALARGESIDLQADGPLHLRIMSRTQGPDAPGGACAPQTTAIARADDPQARTIASGGGPCGTFEAVLDAGTYALTARANQVDLPAHETIVKATALDWLPPNQLPGVGGRIGIPALPAFGAIRTDLEVDRAGTVLLRQGVPWACDGPIIDAIVAPVPVWPAALEVQASDACWQAYAEVSAGRYRVRAFGTHHGATPVAADLHVAVTRRLPDLELVGADSAFPGMAAGGVFTGRNALRAPGGDRRIIRDGLCADDLVVWVRTPTGALLARSTVVDGCAVLSLPRGAPAQSQIIVHQVDGEAFEGASLVLVE